MSRSSNWFDGGVGSGGGAGGFELSSGVRGNGGFGMRALRMEDEEEEQPHKLATRCCNFYFRSLKFLRHAVLLFWLGALGVAIWLGPRFLSSTKDSFDPPSGTASAQALDVWRTQYPDAAHQHTLIVLLACGDGSHNANCSVVDGAGKVFSQRIDHELNDRLLNRTAGELPNAGNYRRIDSYWSALNSPVPSLASKLLAPDQRSMVFNLAFTDDGGNSAVDKIVKYVRALVKDLSRSIAPPTGATETFSLGVTGGDALDADIGAASKDDFEHTDIIILPIALFVLMLYLKSVRLMVLPIVCVGLSLLCAMAAMFPVAKLLLDVASFTPSIMASLTVAMSVDYSLFLLTRYREEILSGVHRSESDAVAATLRTSGEVILASGVTLAMTFASLIAFPMDFLQSIGVGAVATISACLLVNLSFTPAMLLTFPRFFSDFTMPRFFLCILPRMYTRDVPARRFGDNGLDEAFLPSAVINMDAQARSAGVHAGLAQELLFDDHTNGESGIGGGDSSFGQPSFANAKYLSPRAREEAERARRAADAAARSRFRSRSLVDVVDDAGLDGSPRAAGQVSSPRLLALRAEQEGSCWYKSAKFTTGTWRAVAIVLLLLGASVPFILATARLKYTVSQEELLPSSSDAVQVLDKMKASFPPGLIAQYHVLLTVNKDFLPEESQDMPILSAEYLATTTLLVRSMLDRELVANSSVMSLVYAGGEGEDAWTSTPEEALAKWLRGCDPSDPGSASSCLFFLQVAETSNSLDLANATCTQTTLMTSFEPMGDEAEPWIKSVRQMLDEQQQLADAAWPGAFRFYLTGGATSAVDAIERIYALLPIVAAVTCGCVMLLTGLLFRSLVVPLRLVLTLAVPLVYTYGLAVFVFQDHTGFGWLGSRVADAKGLYWLNPVMAFSILVGLGLDYDLFVSLRIAEFRALGYSSTSAIRKGVWKTGSVITGAGVIMSIAFAGLMMSSTAVLLEFGAMLMSAVLFDTFIVRTIFLPAVLHLLGEANWWPGRQPTPTKGDADQIDVDDQHEAQATDEAQHFRLW